MSDTSDERSTDTSTDMSTNAAIDNSIDYQRRRQRVFLILSGVFLGTLALLNVLGISRFLDLSFNVFGLEIPMFVAVGVLPYPITFLCTDLISELYGEKKAQDMVWVGLLLNIWVVFLLWLGGILPGSGMDPVTGQVLVDEAGREPVFFEVRQLAFGAVAASMIAYLAAQFCDVKLFHFWKRVTNGKHLWLRNNASTFTSQLIDTGTILVLLCLSGSIAWDKFWILLLNGFLFKVLMALIDTPILYLVVGIIRKKFKLEVGEELDF